MAETNSSAASRRRSVAIVGAGMAGVSLAWLLDGARDVVLLEARDSVGGNVQSLEVDLDGHRVMVDLGAQYFHPGPYPVYSALLRELGLYEPDSPGGAAHSFPASITMTAGIGATPRFVSPVLPEQRWPFFAPWNAAGLGAFGVGFIGARVREHLDQPWDVALDEWLPSLGLARKQWEGMLLPWAASLFSGSIAQARRLSARAAMIFAARALPANPFDPLHYGRKTSCTKRSTHTCSRQWTRCGRRTGWRRCRVRMESGWLGGTSFRTTRRRRLSCRR